MKIAILGYSGSGKSTLSKDIGTRYNLPVLYLDRVQFLPGWIERDSEEAIKIVSNFIKEDSWIIDGNYPSLLQKERLAMADKIIYMKFNRLSCLARVIKRFLKYRNQRRESMAEGCNEKIDLEFILWILYRGRSREKREYYKNILNKHGEKVTIIKNQKELNQFMKFCDLNGLQIVGDFE